jgi:hypothetical protein
MLLAENGRCMSDSKPGTSGSHAWTTRGAILAVVTVAVALCFSPVLAASRPAAVPQAQPRAAASLLSAGRIGHGGLPSDPPVPAEHLPREAQQPGVRAGTLEWPDWSGYAVAAGQHVLINEVTAQFTVPAVNCYTSSPTGQGAWLVEWAGIDGLVTPTVEQAGIEAYCASKSSTPGYYGWYEMYPSAAVVRIGVNPGDDVTVSISRYRDGKYRLALRDVTEGVGFSVVQPCPAGSSCEAASAELITEAVFRGGQYLPLADYEALTFADATVRANYGQYRGTLAAGKHWTSTKIDMVNSRGSLESEPGPLYAGSDFTNAWKSS